MPRRNSNGAGRRFDTRLSFMEMSRIMKLTGRQKIQMRRYLLERIEGVSKKD